MLRSKTLNFPYLIIQESAQYYECSYSCDHALVLVCGSEKFFITDGRYDIEARECVKSGVEVIKSQNLLKDFCKVVQKNNIHSLIFDPLNLSVADYERMKAMLPHVSFEGRENFHQELRKIKTQEEIEKIRISQSLNKEAFLRFGASLKDCLGKSERELHFLSKQFLTKGGQYDLSFDPIFALNGNGAKAHALPCAESFLKRGDWILFDAGIKYERYCSDMTRCTLMNEEVDFFASPKMKSVDFQKVYEIVKEAKEHTIKHIREGMKAKKVDALARGVIEKRGYGQYFTHSTGHGIGLDIHELPRISSGSEEVIEEGMVFSVEPGIYLADEIGVRLEDLVVIKNGRAEIL